MNPYVYMTNAELYVALKEITFGGRGQFYQNAQQYQDGRSDQNFQDYQNY